MRSPKKNALRSFELAVGLSLEPKTSKRSWRLFLASYDESTELSTEPPDYGHKKPIDLEPDQRELDEIHAMHLNSPHVWQNTPIQWCFKTLCGGIGYMASEDRAVQAWREHVADCRTCQARQHTQNDTNT